MSSDSVQKIQNNSNDDEQNKENNFEDTPQVIRKQTSGKDLDVLN